MQKLLTVITVPIFIFACSLTQGSTSTFPASPVSLTKMAMSQPTIPFPTSSVICRVKTKVKQGLLNLRSGPGLQYKVIAVLNEGEILTGKFVPTADWQKVTIPTGTEGWVNQNYINCKQGE